jgi:hypothetical protein
VVDDGLLRTAVKLGVEAAVLDDLRHLAPDLVRWHLPRAPGGRAAIAPGTEIVLTSYRGTPLSLYAPRTEAPQLPVLALRTTPEPYRRRRALPRMCWDSRAVDGLRRRCGDAVRTAFFTPHGHRSEPTDGAPASDIERLEWATRQWDAGAVGPALGAYGIEAIEPDPRWAQLPVALDRLSGLVDEVLNEVLGGGASGPPAEGVVIGFGLYPGPALELRLTGRGPSVRPARPGQLHRLRLADPELWQRLPDWDLLRFGLIEATELHPLVQRALFPSAPLMRFAPAPDPPPGPVRIRCRGGWHEANRPASSPSSAPSTRPPHSSKIRVTGEHCRFCRNAHRSRGSWMSATTQETLSGASRA